MTSVMDTWTRQMGFPVVTITKEGNNFELTQQHFLADPKAVVERTSPFKSVNSHINYK